MCGVPPKGFCACVIGLRPPPLLGYYLGCYNNFVGSESGQIQSVKLLLNMVSNRTQHPPATNSKYKLYFDTGRAEGEPEGSLEGQ